MPDHDLDTAEPGQIEDPDLGIEGPAADQPDEEPDEPCLTNDYQEVS